MLEVVTLCVYFFLSFFAFFLFSFFNFSFQNKILSRADFFFLFRFSFFLQLSTVAATLPISPVVRRYFSLSHKIRCKRCPHERFKTRVSRALSLCLSICSLFSPLNFANIKAIIAVYSAYLQQTEMPHSSKFCCCLC